MSENEDRVCPTCKQRVRGRRVNWWKSWTVLGMMWFCTFLLANFDETLDAAYIVTLVAYLLGWVFFGLTLAGLVDRRLHVSRRLSSWIKK